MRDTPAPRNRADGGEPRSDGQCYAQGRIGKKRDEQATSSVGPVLLTRPWASCGLPCEIEPRRRATLGELWPAGVSPTCGLRPHHRVATPLPPLCKRASTQRNAASQAPSAAHVRASCGLPVGGSRGGATARRRRRRNRSCGPPAEEPQPRGATCSVPELVCGLEAQLGRR